MTNPDLAALSEAATQLANRCEGISHVIHCIADKCEDEGDRVYLGSTNDVHTLVRQARALMALAEKLRSGNLVQIDEGMRERVLHNERFQSACQRYAHNGGSSEAIAAAAIAAMMGGAK